MLTIFIYLACVKYVSSLRPIVRLLSVFVLFVVLSIAYYAVSDPEGFITATSFLWGGGSLDGSTMFRLMQYPLIFSAMLDNPLFGYGVKNHVIQDLNTPLDNYYLRVLIESGFIGLTAFFAQVLFVAKFVTSEEHLSQLTPAFSKQVCVVVMLYLASFIGYKIFISMSYNNIYFYFVCGALIALSGDRNWVKQNRYSVSDRERSESVHCKNMLLRSSKSQVTVA